MTGPGPRAAGELAHLMARLPPVLASAAALKRVAAFELAWPGGAAAQIVELRLDGSGRAVDISRAYRPEDLAALAAAVRLRPGLVALVDILTWAAGTGRPRSLWLEWDLPDSPSPEAAVPSLFLALPEDRGADWPYWQAALRQLGRDKVLPALSRVLGLLPAGVTLRQLGVMLARRDPVVRLVLDIPTPDQARALIADLRPDVLGRLEALFALPGFAAAPRLDLDLTPEGIGPRIALELPAMGLTPQALASALSGLATLTVIDDGAAKALSSLAEWTCCGAQASAGLNHLKASAGAGTLIEIKAYLGMVETGAPLTALRDEET